MRAPLWDRIREWLRRAAIKIFQWFWFRNFEGHVVLDIIGWRTARIKDKNGEFGYSTRCFWWFD